MVRRRSTTRSGSAWFRGITVLMVAAVLATSCTSDDGGDAAPTPSSGGSSTVTTRPGGTGPDQDPVTQGRSASGVLGLRLSEGEAEAAQAEPVALVDGAPLDDAALAAIFERLGEWVDEAALREAFRFPAQTLGPPRTGETVDVAFPPAPDDSSPAEVPTGPLEVQRFQPEGEVAVAPFVTITFNQPMVPLGTLDQLDAAEVPATITPDVPGRWQWIGTRTLRFDAFVDADGQPLSGDDAAPPPDRLPMSTEYTVTIPAGTESATGGTLADDVTFSFATPPVTVQAFVPDDSTLPLEPVFVAIFDQIVDAEAVLAHIVLRVGADGGGEQRAVRLATEAEIEADDTVGQLLGSLGSLRGDRWIAFRPVEPLPADSAVTVEIEAGTPSAEGPRTTIEPTVVRNRTYAPLRVVATDCGYGPECPPGTTITVRFNNPLDLDQLDPETVRIEPELRGAFRNVYADVIEIGGVTEARTTYTVTVPAGIVDIYGQGLAEDNSDTVEIGPAVPILHPFSQPLTTLDPLAEGQTLSVRSIGHDDLRAQVFAVEPDDWDDYLQYFIDTTSDPENEATVPAWPELADTTLDTGDDPDRLSETLIDLADALGDDGLGHVVVRVEATETYNPNSNEFWQNRPTVTWVQATDIGLDAFSDDDELFAWATDLTTGAPIPGVAITATGSGQVDQVVTTDGEGVATLELGANGVSALVATRGDDTALLTPDFYGSEWSGFPVDDTAVWYVIDDRQVYRPGETVSVKGVVRRLTSSGDAQLQLLDDRATVDYLVRDPQGNEIATGSAQLSPLGGFDFRIDVPVEANLGRAFVELTLQGVGGISFAATQHFFDIQEFRRPEFEVVARHESPGPYVSSHPATVAADANYYAGGPLGAAPVDWRVTTADATYAPPGWDEFSFGEWTPWWIAYDPYGFGFDGGFGGDVFIDESCCFGPFGQDPVDVEVYSGTTDAAGSHYLQIDFVGPEGTLPDLPVTVTAEASVTDVNRQVLASRTSVLVHPGQLYVGLRGTRTFVREGDPLDIEAIVTDIDGAVVAGRALTITAERLEWAYEDGQWSEQPAEAEDCTVTSATEPVTCSFTTTVGGTYTISSTIADDDGGASRSELTRWVTGGDGRPSRTIEQESLTIVPDAAEYGPGDTAELLVQSPFSGHGLATITRNGIDSTQTFEVVDGSAVVEIAITDRQIPGIAVSFEVVGTSPRTADDGTPLPDVAPRPAFATGQIALPISTAARALTVTAVPRADAVEPGTTTGVDVTVVNAAGAPVAGAEVAVIVVDEAVLALSGYEVTDPLAVFYGQLGTYIQATYGRQSIVLVDPASLFADDATGASGGDQSAGASATTTVAAEEAPAPTADGALTGEAAREPARFDFDSETGQATTTTPIGERSDFDALAVFEPSLVTDASGAVSVDVPLPDNLTRYRVIAVAVAGADRFGSAEANITARLPLMVRPSAPRFANFGDRFELPVVVQNQTDAVMEVDVAIQTSNLTLDGPAGKRVSVPANDRVEVRFPVTTDHAGTARFRVAAVSAGTSAAIGAADATVIELPVYTPATAEVFATYGVLDGGATIQPLLGPTGVVPQFGGLEVTTSSTALQALTDAMLYIAEYPYDSADARASRIMSIVALRDVLEAFDAEGLPDPAELDAAVNADIAGLVGLQNLDGGFPSWARDRRSEPYQSIQATHALALARGGGFDVPEQTIATALGYIADIESHVPPEYGREARETLSAYALHVRMLAGDRDVEKAQALWDDRGEELALDAIAWLWPVIDDAAIGRAIGRIFDNRAVETAAAANFTTEVTDDDYVILRSDRRTDGLALASLISERPQSDLIPKIVAGLLGNQTRGRWDNIQENVFILLALKGYFDTFEAQTPDFVARVWLGETFAGEHIFVGRSTDRARISVPTATLIASGDTDIVVGHEGTGRLYYRLGLRYAPDDLRLDALDRGFVVERTYEAVDDPGDVTRDADGTWRIKAGVSVRVRLRMVAESQRTHVALIDPLPAGLEILNPALATTPEIPDDPAADPGFSEGDGIRPYCEWWCWPTWFEHQNLRDDRAEAIATLLPAGAYDYTYVARATTPGTFVVPPSRAEEIYAPETFGRTATDIVVIAD